MKILDRQQLTNIWSAHLHRFNSGYWITLNSKKQVSSFTDQTLNHKIIRFSSEIDKFVGFLNEFCYGRQYLKHRPGARLACLAGYEVGNEDGMIHAHIVAAHDGSTDRSVSDVARFTNRKWSSFYRFDGSTTFVDVACVGNIKNRVWYITKQAEAFQRLHGDFNLTLH